MFNFSNKKTKYYNDGSRYVGSFYNAKRHGYGDYYYANGNVYNGNWENGVKHGYGIMYYSADGCRYEGNWVDGKRSQEGILYYPSGARIDGYWKDDKPYSAEFYYANGEKYIGDLRDFKRDGKGVYYYNNGNVFEGFYYKNQKTKGVTYYSNGNETHGKYKDDKLCGIAKSYKQDGSVWHCYYNYGTFELVRIAYPSNDIYEGSVSDSVPNRSGAMYYNDNEVYKGTWKDGKWHGYGFFNMNDRSRYEGQFANHKFHGLGTYYYNNGDRYEGYFKEGFMSGFGTYRGEDSHIFYGYYENDLLNGFGYEFIGNTRYIGYYKDSLFHGFGEFVKEDIKYIGEFKEGKEHGRGAVFQNGQLKFTGIFEDGIFLRQQVLDEDFIEKMKVFLNEELRPINFKKYDGAFFFGKIVNGLRHGYGCLEFDDGRKFIGRWENDVLIEAVGYTSDGKKYIGNFTDGRFTGYGMKLINSNNNTFSNVYPATDVMIGEFIDLVPNGLCFEFYSDGNYERQTWQNKKITKIVRLDKNKSLIISNVVDGEIHGTCIFIDSNDEELYEFKYHYGVLEK